MNKPLNWFEIPTSNLEKATKFYETAIGITLRPHQDEHTTMSVFPYDRDTTVGGALIQSADHQPGVGTIPYLNAGNELDAVLSRAVAQGATVVLPRTALPPGMGFYAHILDPDGNKIGFHGAQ